MQSVKRSRQIEDNRPALSGVRRSAIGRRGHRLITTLRPSRVRRLQIQEHRVLQGQVAQVIDKRCVANTESREHLALRLVSAADHEVRGPGVIEVPRRPHLRAFSELLESSGNDRMDAVAADRGVRVLKSIPEGFQQLSYISLFLILQPLSDPPPHLAPERHLLMSIGDHPHPDAGRR